ncbi:MAG: lipoprotein [Methylophilaceae bacterium]|nr:lipoprotein [Methylophilaceae bacterium]
MRFVCIALMMCLMLTACGAKGPLYLPEQKYPQPQQDRNRP